MTLLISPAPYGIDGLEFGNRTVWPYNEFRAHRGKDHKWRIFDVFRSRQVVAPVSGRVTAVWSTGGDNDGWGNRVEITVPATGHVIEAALNHLETGTIQVSVGDWVTAGDYIAQMGDTGEAGGVHLHEELWIDGIRVDPDFYRTHHLPGTPALSGGPAKPITPEEETDMPTSEEIADVNWHGIKFKNGRTPGQELVSQGETLVRIELALARLGNTGRFYKHGGAGIRLWVYVLPNGDFVRIRDLDTARLYLERNGTPAVTLSTEAIRQLVGDLVDAGGQDLTAVPGTTDTRATTAAEAGA